MANTTVTSGNDVDQWQDSYFKEYVRETRFKKYMGTSVNACIQMIEDLTRKAGDDISVSLVTRLSGSGVTGDNALETNEEALGNFVHKLTVNCLRNAVSVGRMEQQKTKIDLLEAAKVMLKMWSMANLRDATIAAMQSANVDGSTAYASCSEAQKDAWLAANTDRVLFGAAKSNNSSNDHSASLSNVDSSNDILTPAIVSLVKRMAMTADPHIRPIRAGDDEEWYILFANSLAFRDLAAHSTMRNALQYAAARGKDNPLFTSGDLIWDNIIIREVPEIAVISGVGASSIDVAPNFLCGAQAVGVAWAERPTAIFDKRDYGQINGVGIRETRGVEKLMFNSIQNGIVTVYTAGVADT